MMLLSWRLSEISMPAITMRRRRLDRSNRLSIISPRVFSSTFPSSPKESRKSAGTTDARVQCSRAANTGLVCRKQAEPVQTQADVTRSGAATVSLPTPLQFCRQSLLIFVTLPKIRIFWARRFLASAELSNPSGFRARLVPASQHPVYLLLRLVHQLRRQRPTLDVQSRNGIARTCSWGDMGKPKSRWPHFLLPYSVRNGELLALNNGLFVGEILLPKTFSFGDGSSVFSEHQRSWKITVRYALRAL